jgi:signal transduction histidine kinase
MPETVVHLPGPSWTVRFGARRGIYYLLLTAAVGVAYVGAVVLFNLILRAGAVTDSPAFPIAFTLAVLLFFNPLRTRLQDFVDRVFFRTRYDGAQVLASVGAELAATLRRDQIVRLVREAVDAAIPNSGTMLLIAEPGERGLGERAADAHVTVPVQRGGEVLGVLAVGAKRSGLGYTAGDREFLRALAHQAAIALGNAASYEALVELHAHLERRVRERTTELERANQELGAAYTDLKHAEAKLVQAEKMASLGRLVAGVAHEINNPVSFIATSVEPLRRRLAKAAQAAPPLAPALREAEDVVAIRARGAERTAAIVKDLRTFSRLGEATRKTVDLHDGLDMSIRLLEARWRDRITIHRDYGAVPPVECDPAQMNQVFMNVLSNALDAIPARGNVWITTRTDDASVAVEVRDDGAGMPPEVQSRMFEPFFTTKETGKGTGLGLAIGQSVVAAHDGRLEVESAPGEGTTLRIVLPLLDRNRDVR